MSDGKRLSAWLLSDLLDLRETAICHIVTRKMLGQRLTAVDQMGTSWIDRAIRQQNYENDLGLTPKQIEERLCDNESRGAGSSNESGASETQSSAASLGGQPQSETLAPDQQLGLVREDD